MKILIAGNSFFSKKLANGLAQYDSVGYYKSIRTDDSFLGKLIFIVLLPFFDVVYHLGGELYSSNLIDIALFLRKKVIMHWIGSDVSIAIENFSSDKVNNRYINSVRHFCEVSWIQNELRFVGLETEIVQIAAVKNIKSEELEGPFSIFTYVGKGKEIFYGMDWLIKLAVERPDIQIVIAGISGYNDSLNELPENMKFIGWVDNIYDYYKNNALYLRLTKHDGLAFSVIEALSIGRYVGYTQKFPATEYLRTYEDLLKFVNLLHSRMVSGVLEPNEFGSDFVRENYSEDKVLGILMKKLKFS